MQRRGSLTCSQAKTIAQQAIYETSPPRDGSEMSSHTVLKWCQYAGVGCHDIAPCKSMQNVFAGSLNRRLRDECLNENLFGNLTEAHKRIGLQHQQATQVTRRANTNRVHAKATFHPTGLA